MKKLFTVALCALPLLLLAADNIPTKPATDVNVHIRGLDNTTQFLNRSSEYQLLALPTTFKDIHRTFLFHPKTGRTWQYFTLEKTNKMAGVWVPVVFNISEASLNTPADAVEFEQLLLKENLNEKLSKTNRVINFDDIKEP